MKLKLFPVGGKALSDELFPLWRQQAPASQDPALIRVLALSV